MSTEKSDAHGKVNIDYKNSLVKASVAGLSAAGNWDLWLVDNQAGPNLTVKPELGDKMLRVGTF